MPYWCCDCGLLFYLKDGDELLAQPGYSLSELQKGLCFWCMWSDAWLIEQRLELYLLFRWPQGEGKFACFQTEPQATPE